jgi:hypothetical protein
MKPSFFEQVRNTAEHMNRLASLEPLIVELVLFHLLNGRKTPLQWMSQDARTLKELAETHTTLAGQLCAYLTEEQLKNIHLQLLKRGSK